MRLEQNSQNDQKLGFFWTLRWNFLYGVLEFFKIATCGKFLESVGVDIFHKNRKTFGWDLFNHVERAVAWIFRTWDANLIFIRSFSYKCLFTLWGSFGWKSNNITILEKLKKRTKKQGILKTKRFHPSEKHLQQRLRARSIAEIAGWLV